MNGRIPVFICNRDRLTWPRQLAADLTREARCEVIIVDNASTYPPLLEWYETCPHEVVRLKENRGPQGDWGGEIDRRLTSDYFIITDPDLDISQIPADWLSVLMDGLRFDGIDKVGLSLRTDDVPEGPDRDEIVAWESGFQRWPINERYYWARIDTTLALYDRRRWVPTRPRFRDRALRTAAPYAARHLPWYPMDAAMQKEEDYQLLHCDPRISHWSSKRIADAADRNRDSGLRE
jgi:hypothetical protein